MFHEQTFKRVFPKQQNAKLLSFSTQPLLAAAAAAHACICYLLGLIPSEFRNSDLVAR